MKIEKIIDPAVDPVGASNQTAQPWVSFIHGGWIVTGTNSIEEGKQFVRQFLLDWHDTQNHEL